MGIHTNRKLLSTDNPETPSKAISKKLRNTIKKSKIFHPSLKYTIGLRAINLRKASDANIAVKTCKEIWYTV
jgi:hypothetical protein